MILLNVRTRQREEFFGNAIPPYAILSHTWGIDEVTFQDLSGTDHRQKLGYAKIDGCCRQATRDGLHYCWVDTCCIDKSSSAELSEAINSMFSWYEASAMCYAFLEDVFSGQDAWETDSAFRASRWFTRGWTLQELLAPRTIQFYAHDWRPIHLAGYPLWSPANTLLSEVTGIPETIFSRELLLSEVSAACKLSWAANRVTTRVEDSAYSLLGLLGVNMPLLYGEGNKAFVRLQEVVLSTSNDISVLAWGYNNGGRNAMNTELSPALARSVSDFRGFPQHRHRHVRRPPKVHTTISGHGIHIELPIICIDRRKKVFLGVVEESLEGYDDKEARAGIAIVLRQREEHNSHNFERARGSPAIRVYDSDLNRLFAAIPISRVIYLQDSSVPAFRPIEFRRHKRLFRAIIPPSVRPVSTALEKTHGPRTIAIHLDKINALGYFLSSFYPPSAQYRIHDSIIYDNSESSFPCLEIDAWDTSCCAVFANNQGHFFALRIRPDATAKPSSNDIEFAQLAADADAYDQADIYCATALEYCCDTRIGVRKPLMKEEARWKTWAPISTAQTRGPGHFRASEPYYGVGRHQELLYGILYIDGHYQAEKPLA